MSRLRSAGDASYDGTAAKGAGERNSWHRLNAELLRNGFPAALLTVRDRKRVYHGPILTAQATSRVLHTTLRCRHLA